MLGGVVTVVLMFLATSCGAGSSQGEDHPASPPSEATTDTTTSSPKMEVFFPTVRPLAAVPSAALQGKLVLDKKGCLSISADPDITGEVPLWPSYYKLDIGGGKVRVLDQNGRVVAQVGERVIMGGGEIGEKS